MKYLTLFFAALALALILPAAPQGYPLCTQAQHDAYQVKGPDGMAYLRWHPQIDPILHCAYAHEHGSDPGAVLPSFGSPYNVSAADVPFGYVSSHHMMVEPHEGFKVFAFNDRAGHIWRLSIHMGSSGTGRVCTRFHEVQVLIVSATTWDVLANVGFMGDFGVAASNQGGDLTPTACPNQGATARIDGSTGVRQFGVYSQRYVSYAPWRLDDHRLIIPIDLHALTIWTDPPINDCQDSTCDVLVQNYTVDGKLANGANRFFQYYPGTGIKASSTISGTFYTDPLGRQLLDPSDTHAVKQYIKPGAAFALPQPYGKCFQWGIAALYNCGGYGAGWPYANTNGAIIAPN
jgi:hypothetical protein